MSAVYSCLGFVSEMRYTDRKGDEYILEFFSKKSWSLKTGKDAFLMVSKGNREIVFIPWKKPKKVKAPKGQETLKKLYSDWTKYDNTCAFAVNMPKAKMALIGHITRIEYTSDKFESKGDRPDAFHIYRHNFKNKQRLYSNAANTIFAIRSNKTLLDYRGIIG